ncbi:MAG: DNA polymerase III subunit beta [Bifidobacteriaceae bacterium]|jgi:DNA polymerase-3 subunit beta|nr:DNA polymerase III subunit beta [Bifidobacteriaceae bacterium]
MKFKIEKNVLVPALSKTVAILAARPLIPSLAGIRLEVNESGSMEITGSNGDISIVNRVEVEEFEPGGVLLAGKQLFQIVQSLPLGVVSFEEQEAKTLISSAAAHFSLAKMAFDQYPELPKIPESIGQIEGPVLRDALDIVLISVDKNDDNSVLSGILFKIDNDKITLFTTDKYRISKRIISWKPNQALEKSILVKGNTLGASAKAIADNPQIELRATFGQINKKPIFDAQLFGLSAENEQITSNVMAADMYPPLEQLFEMEFLHDLFVEKEKILPSLERAAIVAQSNTAVQLLLSRESLIVKAGDAAEADINEQVPAIFKSELKEMKISFSPIYLLEGIRAIPDKWVHLKILEPVKAVQFVGHSEHDQPENPNFTYVLVPIFFNG